MRATNQIMLGRSAVTMADQYATPADTRCQTVKIRLLSTAFIVILLLLLMACQPTGQLDPLKDRSVAQAAPAETTTIPGATLYRNPVHGYTIAIPEGWEVDDSDADHIKIGNYPEIAVVQVQANRHTPLLDTLVEAALKEYVSPWDDAELTFNAKPRSVWDWELAYRYSWGAYEFDAQILFIESADAIYQVHWEASESSRLAETCRAIARTFRVE